MVLVTVTPETVFPGTPDPPQWPCSPLVIHDCIVNDRDAVDVIPLCIVTTGDNHDGRIDPRSGNQIIGGFVY